MRRLRRESGSHPRLGQLRTSESDALGAQGVSPTSAGRWKTWTVWPAMGATLGAVLAGRALVRRGGDPRTGVVIGLIVENLLCLALAVFFAAAQAKPRAVDFGLRRPQLLRAAGLTTLVGLALFVLSAAWVAALGLADSGPSITERLVADRSTSHALLVLVMVAVAVPLGEEFVFRGYVYRALRNRWGAWPAAVLSGVGFAVTHVGWLPLGLVVFTAVFGLGLCLLYHWTGSLYPTLALHAVANSLPTATDVGWTWQVPLAVVFSVLATLVLARLVAVALDAQSSGSIDRSRRAPVLS